MYLQILNLHISDKRVKYEALKMINTVEESNWIDYSLKTQQ